MKWHDFARLKCPHMNPRNIAAQYLGPLTELEVISFLRQEGLKILDGNPFDEALLFITAKTELMQYMDSVSCFARARIGRGVIVAFLRRTTGMGYDYISRRLGRRNGYYRRDVAFAEEKNFYLIQLLINEFHDTRAREKITNLSEESTEGAAA